MRGEYIIVEVTELKATG